MMEQLFEYIDPDTKQPLFFEINKLKALVDHPQTEHFSALIDPEFYRIIIEDRGVEPERLNHYLNAPLSVLDEPVLGCLMDCGSTLTVDGHHRIAARMQRGINFVPMHRFPKKLWRKALTTPEEFFRGGAIILNGNGKLLSDTKNPALSEKGRGSLS